MKRVALLVFACAGVAGAQELPEQSFQRRKVLTADGAALALYRYVPAGGGAQHPAILLVPDLGFAKEAYDFQSCGLARFLQARGRDTFVVELRGQGRSSAPSNWSLTDWVEKDLPAAVAAIRTVHDGPVDLVVQGYSGGLALAATTKELHGRVGRVIALNAQTSPQMPNALLRSVLTRGGKFSGLSAREFEVLFTHDALFAKGTATEFRGIGLQDISPTAAAQLLTWMDTGVMVSSDGTKLSERLGDYDRPTLLLMPLLDNFAHPEHASTLRDTATKAKVRALVLSKFELLSEDYTHLSVLLGKHAEKEIFELVATFLNESEVTQP